MVEFILVGEGMLKIVFNFYDFENEVFYIMLLDEKFFLIFFLFYDWLLFLKKVGLVVEVFKGFFFEYVK